MLQPMQQSAESAPSPSNPSFAGLLATLASTAHRPGVDTDGSLSAGWKKPEAYGDRPSSHGWKSPSDWNDDDPADDVSTLSYERALRTHSRYRAADLTDTSLTNPPKPRFVDSYELAPEETQPANAGPPAPSASRRVAADSEGKFNQDSSAAGQPGAACRPSTPFERNLKNASITIRMSKEECTQLHRRAAEAGLTVSAYLRSCTFEAESLRALVKDTMAQLRHATAAGTPPDEVKARSGWFVWLKRLFTPWQGSPRTARA
jgi:predicted DNA binding CopG/RHH family protein